MLVSSRPRTKDPGGRPVLPALFFVVLVVAGILIGACDRGPEPKLAALRQEPVAILIPPGGRLDHENYVEEYTTMFGQGQPVHASIFRVFVYDNEAAGMAAQEALIEAAQASGWKMDLEDNPVLTGVFGEKTLATGAAILRVGLVDNEGVIKVSVWLQHG